MKIVTNSTKSLLIALLSVFSFSCKESRWDRMVHVSSEVPGEFKAGQFVMITADPSGFYNGCFARVTGRADYYRDRDELPIAKYEITTLLCNDAVMTKDLFALETELTLVVEDKE